MKRFCIFLLLALFAHAAFAANYFIKFEANNRVPALSVEIGDIQLGPLPISKYGSASFGPINVPFPDQAIARWKTSDGASQATKRVSFTLIFLFGD